MALCTVREASREPGAAELFPEEMVSYIRRLRSHRLIHVALQEREEVGLCPLVGRITKSFHGEKRDWISGWKEGKVLKRLRSCVSPS